MFFIYHNLIKIKPSPTVELKFSDYKGNNMENNGVNNKHEFISVNKLAETNFKNHFSSLTT